MVDEKLGPCPLTGVKVMCPPLSDSPLNFTDPVTVFVDCPHPLRPAQENRMTGTSRIFEDDNLKSVME